MKDIVTKIKDYAPTDIEKFQSDTERRAQYNNQNIEKMLSSIMKNIDGYALPEPMAHRYFDIRAQLVTRKSFSDHV